VNTGEQKDVPIGSSLEELIGVFGVTSPCLIANAKVNNKTESLAYRV
jgi:uridine kinase